MKDKAYGYVAGGIMTRGEQLAREEECRKLDEANLDLDYYSPAQNKDINDKSNMTEEENNKLAEKIVAADVARLWQADFTVVCPEQSAIGTMCEAAILYAWKYMGVMLGLMIEMGKDKGYNEKVILNMVSAALRDQIEKKNFFHYADIRTNHLNEKDWRRSFSINQFLYGVILAASADGKLHDNFDEVVEELKKVYGTKE